MGLTERREVGVRHRHGGRSNDGLQGASEGQREAMVELNPATDAHDDRLDALRRSPRLQYPREAGIGRTTGLKRVHPALSPSQTRLQSI